MRWHSLGFLVLIASCFTLRASLLSAQTEVALDELKSISIVTLKAETYHVQGIVIEEDNLWVSSVERKLAKGFLQLFDFHSGDLKLSKEIEDGTKIHPGGIALDGESIWVPVAEYRRLSTAHIERRDKNSLELISRFTVEDHIGCVAVSPEGLIYGGNWDARQIYCWDREGKLLWKKDNPFDSHYQDMKFVGGHLVCSGGVGKGSGVIEWLDPETLALSRRILGGTTDRGVNFMNEGMEIVGGVLYLLPEDTPSRLFSFELPAQ